MKIGRKIGEGANAEVFEWEDDTKVIKLAKATIDRTYLEKEFTNTLTMWKLGLAVPQPYKMIDYHNRPGIVFERIFGKTLRERFFENLVPQNDNVHSKLDWNDARLTARLFGEVHHSLPNEEILSQQRQFLKNQILSVDYLSPVEKGAVLTILDGLPAKHNICHGDANPNNILFSNGQPVLIDWMNAANGNPEVDLAEFIIMIRYAILPPETPSIAVELFDLNREKIINDFMEEYTSSTGITYDEVERWIIPIAARKLSTDGITEKEKQLLVSEIRLGLESTN